MRKLGLSILLLSGLHLFAQTGEKLSGTPTVGISEINYHSDIYYNPKNWVELYNYGNTAVDISNWKLRDDTPINVFTIPAGTSLAPSAYLVLAQDVDSFHLIFPAVSNVIGSFLWGFGDMTDNVRLQDQFGTTLISLTYVDSIPWPNAADGYGPTLQISDITADANDPTNWFAGCVGGTPGSAYVPCNYKPTVSEINYHSNAAFNTGDWIEIWNNTGSTLSLNGWVLRDKGNTHTFNIPTGTSVPVDGRIVLSDSLTAFTTLYPGVTNVVGEYNFGYGAGGDAVRLYDNTGKLRYSLRYDDKTPWPIDADGNGYTLELDDPAGNPNLAVSWVAGCPHGSPGSAFVLPCPGVLVADYDHTTVHVEPNPFYNAIAITFSSGNAAVSIYVTDFTGRKIANLPLTYSGNVNYAEWNGKTNNGDAAAGIYFITAETSTGEHYSTKIMKAY